MGAAIPGAGYEMAGRPAGIKKSLPEGRLDGVRVWGCLYHAMFHLEPCEA